MQGACWDWSKPAFVFEALWEVTGKWFWFTNWLRAVFTRLAERNEPVDSGAAEGQNTSPGKGTGEAASRAVRQVFQSTG